MDKILDPISKARNLRKNQTDAERLLWKHLRLRQVGSSKFRRQQPMGDYIVDFVCLEHKLIIELDGGQHTEQAVYDENRSAWLRERGYRVLRFWNHEVLTETDAVMRKILEALEESAPSPRSSPSEGRGCK